MACEAEYFAACAAAAVAGASIPVLFAPPPIDVVAAGLAIAGVVAFIGAEWALYNCLQAAGKADEAERLKRKIEEQQRQIDDIKKRLGI